MELTEKKEWSIDLDGFQCSIIFWSDDRMKKNRHNLYPHGGIWNSYIYIDSKQLGRQFKKLIPPIRTMKYPSGTRRYYSFSSVPVPMAYGVTYFEAHRDVDGKIVGVKIGNDYHHIWNENQYITEETVLTDLKDTIERLKKQFPNYLVRSHVNGRYVKPTELEEYNRIEHAKLFHKAEVPSAA